MNDTPSYSFSEVEQNHKRWKAEQPRKPRAKRVIDPNRPKYPRTATDRSTDAHIKRVLVYHHPDKKNPYMDVELYKKASRIRTERRKRGWVRP